MVVSFVRVAVMAVVYAAGACVVAGGVGAMAVGGLAIGSALALKAVLVAAMLVLVTWRGAGGAPAGPRSTVLVVVAAAVGFAINPFTWAARTFVGQLVGVDGAVALAVDLVAWLAVVLATVRVAALRRGTGQVSYA